MNGLVILIQFKKHVKQRNPLHQRKTMTPKKNAVGPQKKQ